MDGAEVGAHGDGGVIEDAPLFDEAFFEWGVVV